MEVDFSWSKSRDSVFKFCKRKYYYQYYGSRGDIKDPKVKELLVLKGLCSREMWMGSVVHEMIQYILANYKGGHELHLGELSKKIKSRMEASYKFSETREYREFFSHGGLMEHEYDIYVGELDDVYKKAEECIANFFNSDVFKFIKSKRIDDWIFLEDFLEFDFDGEKVYLKIDFAVKDGDKVILFDWKTGKERDVEMDIQLVCYALYVMEKFGVDVSDIVVRKYNVALDKEDSFVVSSEMISNVKNYISCSIKEMKLFEGLDEEKFLRSENLRWCSYCNFRKVCRV